MITTSRGRIGAALALATTLGVGVAAMPTAAEAQYRPGWRAAGPGFAPGARYYGPRVYGPRYGYRRGWGPGAAAAGVVGGLALGALAAGALAAPVYPAPVYGAPVYGPACHLEQRRVWTGYGWRWREIEVCP